MKKVTEEKVKDGSNKNINKMILFQTVSCTYLRLARSKLAMSAHKGTIPLRVLLTTKATALAAISLSSTRPLSSLLLSASEGSIKH